MITIENTTKSTIIDCKPSYSLEMDFDSIIFDEYFKNTPSKEIILNKKPQVEISKNFRIPELNYYVLDKYAFTFYEDLEIMDKFAPIPDNKEIAKLSKRPPVRKEIKISKENFVIPMSNYSYDQYDSLFIEDLEFMDKYAPIDKIDDCFLEDKSKESITHNFILSDNVEQKPVISPDAIKREKPAVIASKPSSRFSSLNRVSERRNLDKILRN